MPLGDSLTDGFTVPGGYRIALSQLLMWHDRRIDFVGSLQNGPDELSDRDHEGHSGYTISEIDSGVGAWVEGAQPDIILLLAGTNDALGNTPCAQSIACFTELLHDIAARAPQARILAANVPPLESPPADARGYGLSVAIESAVAQEAAAGMRVSFVDIRSALSTADLSPDGVHLTTGGYSKMGNAWWHALQPFL